jgi:hypothetical protein
MPAPVAALNHFRHNRGRNSSLRLRIIIQGPVHRQLAVAYGWATGGFGAIYSFIPIEKYPFY